MSELSVGVCPLCGGHKTTGRTTFSVDPGENRVVVRNVPALLCTQCGEEWLSDQTTQKLEQIVNEARTKKHQFDVLSM